MIRDNGHPSKIRTFLVEFFRPRYSAKEITQLLVTLFVVQMIGRELLRFNISPDFESIEFLGGSLTVQSYRWHLLKQNPHPALQARVFVLVSLVLAMAGFFLPR